METRSLIGDHFLASSVSCNSNTLYFGTEIRRAGRFRPYHRRCLQVQTYFSAFSSFWISNYNCLAVVYILIFWLNDPCRWLSWFLQSLCTAQLCLATVSARAEWGEWWICRLTQHDMWQMCQFHPLFHPNSSSCARFNSVLPIVSVAHPNSCRVQLLAFAQGRTQRFWRWWIWRRCFGL